MAKPDAAALDPARYPFSSQVDARFGDLDVNWHINNVAMAGMVEEGRVRFNRACGAHEAMQGLGSMVASLGIEYVGQAHYPGTVAIHVGAVRLGNSSYELHLLLMQEGRAVAFARSTIVCTRDGKPESLPQALRTAVKDWMVKA